MSALAAAMPALSLPVLWAAGARHTLTHATLADFSDLRDQASEANDPDSVRLSLGSVQSDATEPAVNEEIVAASEMFGLRLLRAQAAAGLYASVAGISTQPVGTLHLTG